MIYVKRGGKLLLASLSRSARLLHYNYELTTRKDSVLARFQLTLFLCLMLACVSRKATDDAHLMCESLLCENKSLENLLYELENFARTGKGSSPIPSRRPAARLSTLVSAPNGSIMFIFNGSSLGPTNHRRSSVVGRAIVEWVIAGNIDGSRK